MGLEIEIVDPAHPLFGRRFPLVAVSHSSPGARHAMVAYRKDVLLRIPVTATNLFPTPQHLAMAKISLDSVIELVELTSQLGISSPEVGTI
ncbi:MAG: hypothetical protein AB9866_02355 [Syntrophobacteraceae bacterium]